MTYGCPVKSCPGTFDTQTAMLNHVRLKSDPDHDEMWARIKNKAQEEPPEEEEEEEPELSESFEEEFNDQEPEEEDSVTTLQTVDNSSNEEDEGSSMEALDEVEIEKLVENGVVDNVEDGVEKLRKARKNGYNRIDSTTGELA